MAGTIAASESRPFRIAFLFVPLIAWTYFPVLARLVETWSSDPDYSHGYFILPIALYIAWTRRGSLPETLEPGTAGLVVLVGGIAAWLAGVLFNIPPIQEFSFLVTLGGLAWLLFGRGFFLWSLPLLAFLIFMIPLPYSVAVAQAAPLQRFAASAAAYLLQALGIPAWADGNLIQLENQTLGVAYACSGLQMVIAFLAVTSAIALLSDFTWLGKLVVIGSALPIALICNVLRITLTALGYLFFDGERIRLLFHDFGGLVFIPVAIGMALGGIAWFERVFPPVQSSR